MRPHLLFPSDFLPLPFGFGRTCDSGFGVVSMEDIVSQIAQLNLFFSFSPVVSSLPSSMRGETPFPRMCCIFFAFLKWLIVDSFGGIFRRGTIRCEGVWAFGELRYFLLLKKQFLFFPSLPRNSLPLISSTKIC